MRFLKSVQNQEQGHILIVSAFIVFTFASFSIVPVLHFMGTGITTTKNTGLHTQEIYAAEAGIYDSMWKIINMVPDLPRGVYDPPLQTLIDGNVNGKSVNATITRSDSETYRIHSIATNPDTDHQITIESDITILEVADLDLSAFSTFAMTSLGTISTKSNCIVDGDVWIESSDNYTGVSPTGEMVNEPVIGWPTANQLETYYGFLVTMTNPYSDGIIDVSIPSQSGPLYAQGVSNDNYVITGTGSLTGNIYVVGDLYLDANADIDLNGKTIFVTGGITNHPQSCVAGPGSVIALGDIDFSPRVTPSYIFVMSVSGSVDFGPQGAFIGAICAAVNVNLQPGADVTWQDPGIGNLDLPGLYNHITAINTWSIQ